MPRLRKALSLFLTAALLVLQGGAEFRVFAQTVLETAPAPSAGMGPLLVAPAPSLDPALSAGSFVPVALSSLQLPSVPGSVRPEPLPALSASGAAPASASSSGPARASSAAPKLKPSAAKPSAPLLRAVSGSGLLGWSAERLASAPDGDVHAAGRELFEGSRRTSVVEAPFGGLGALEPGQRPSSRQGDGTGGAKTGIAPSVTFPRPSAFRDLIAYQTALIGSFYYYNVPRVTSLWRKVLAFEARTEAEERPVSQSRRLLTDLRLMGSSGRFYVLGFEALQDDVMAKEARELYARYFPADPAARAAFDRFIQRTLDFNPQRRASNLRKNLRDALMDAAMTPRSKLAAYFDGLNTDAKKAERNAFAQSGMAESLAAFKAAVAETVLEEAPGRDQVLGIILLGSYPSGAAGPSSDFDFEVVTRDGSVRRVEAFAARLQSRWTGSGRKTELNPAHNYAMSTSPGLLSRIHWEAFEVVSPYRELVERLSPRGPPAFQPPRTAAWWTGPVVAFFKAVTLAITYAHDVASVFKPAPSGPPLPVDKVLRGLYITRTISIAFFILSTIAMPVLVASIVPPARFAQAFGMMNTLSSGTLIVAGFLNGSLIDRLGARRAMAFGAVGRAVFMLVVPALAFMGVLSYGLLVPMAMANGVLMSMTLVGESAVLPEILKDHPERLQRTNAMLELTFGLTATLGSLVGGHIVSSLGTLNTMLLYAAVHLALVVPLYLHYLPRRGAGEGSASPPPVRHGLARSLRIVLTDKRFLGLLAFTALLSAMLIPLRSTAVPIMNSALTGGNPVALGHLFTAIYAGKALGDLTNILAGGKMKAATLLRAGTVGLLTFGLVLFHWLPAVFLALALANFFASFPNVVLRSMFQQKAQAEHPSIVGRLMGVLGGATNLSITLGNLLMGLAFASFAYPSALAALAAGAVVVAVLFWLAPKVLAARSEGPAPGRRKD